MRVVIDSNTHTHTRTHTCTHARTHARTHTHTHTRKLSGVISSGWEGSSMFLASFKFLPPSYVDMRWKQQNGILFLFLFFLEKHVLFAMSFKSTTLPTILKYNTTSLIGRGSLLPLKR